MKLAVINASNPSDLTKESDCYENYKDGSYFSGNKMIKKCISWHSIPAAHKTEFFVYGKFNWLEVYKYDHVIVLVKESLSEVKPLIKKLKTMKKLVGVGFHENGNYFSSMAQDLNWVRIFKELCDEADYYWNLNICYTDFFKSLLNVPVFSCWHGAPYTEWDHNFIVPLEKREGIMVMTRTFSQGLKRNTLYALGIANKFAKENNTFVDFVCEDNINVHVYLKSLGFDNIQVFKGPLEYEEWLKLIASHRLGFHLDNSDTLGQVVLDGALVDVPIIGGQTENNFFLKTDCVSGVSYGFLTSAYEEEINKKLIDESLTAFKEMTSFEIIRQMHAGLVEQLNARRN